MAKIEWSKPQGDSRRQRGDVGKCRFSVQRRASWDESDQAFIWSAGIPEGGRYYWEETRFFQVGAGVGETADKARAQAGAWLRKNGSTYCGG